MKFYFWILIVAITATSCKNDTDQTEGDYAFLGGEIINANNNFVVISKSKCILDTIILDGKSRFVYKVENMHAGLYTFLHGGEIQMVLLEPNDSIMFRLNTLDFDESLVYTGIGAKKNNYLINEFLQNEIEEEKIFKYCQLLPDNYEKQVDSIKIYKLKKLETFKKKYKTSDLFNKIAQANIHYNYYFNKEIYPFVHYGKNKSKILESLPENFYSYRKEINYNDDFLKDYSNYNTFLRSNFNNIALNVHYEHAKDSIFNRTDLCYNLDRLKLVDSLVTNNTIKESLLYGYTIAYLTKNKNTEVNNILLKSYIAKSNNSSGKEMATRITSSLNNLVAGATIPEIKLINYKNNVLNINSIINSTTVISFWSHTYYEHFKESHYKIKELKAKYPEVKFVLINIDTYGLEASTNSLKRNLFPFANEYRFVNPKASIEMLAIYPMTKALIIDNRKKIVNNNTNIFAINFEGQLLGLINR